MQLIKKNEDQFSFMENSWTLLKEINVNIMQLPPPPDSYYPHQEENQDMIFPDSLIEWNVSE